MMGFLAQLVAWLNELANAIAAIVLAPIGVLPGWLSATIVAIATGVLMLVIFKYTSNQRAIKQTRSDIKANLLALSLFKDNVWVSLRAQARVLVGAFRLLILALVPMLVMLVPMCLLLSQLSLWYQARPLHVGEEALLTLNLQNTSESAWPEVRLQPTSAAQITVGPVRVLSNRMVCWNIRACEDGYHPLLFEIDGQRVDKQLAIGEGFMRVSVQRPGWNWSKAMLHPWEQPFGPNCLVQAIQIDYPTRSSWTSGSNSWLVYWFLASMVAALCFRRVLNVNI